MNSAGLEGRVNTSELASSTRMLHSVKNEMDAGLRKANQPRSRGLTRDTRATVEQVLDPRTIKILEKMMARDVFEQFFGCISTGKEANVYHATRSNDRDDLAVKVFKTSILVFKDRAKYVQGEYRFRHGYGGNNPRKMVAQWAEKEARNLRRISSSGIRCPRPVELRAHVLAMTFIGTKEKAASRLKDAKISQSLLRRAYIEVVAILRLMALQCKLVHGDLSEFNLLWHEDHVYVIDVSQSVEFDHPYALDFLKRDCLNVTNFFDKMLVEYEDDTEWRPFSVPRLFEIVSSKAVELPVTDNTWDLYEVDGGAVGENMGGGATVGSAMDEGALMEGVVLFAKTCSGLQVLLEESVGEEHRNEVEEAVFLNSWLPTHLDQIGDLMTMEEELERRQRGEAEVHVAHLMAPLTREEEDEDEEDEEDEEEEEGEEEGDEEDEEEEGDEEGGEKKFDGKIPEGYTRKEWQKKVKAERREKIKDKIPKHIKKRHRKKAANR